MENLEDLKTLKDELKNYKLDQEVVHLKIAVLVHRLKNIDSLALQQVTNDFRSLEMRMQNLLDSIDALYNAAKAANSKESGTTEELLLD